MADFTMFTAADAGSQIAVPGESDDKYSRGVLGIVTGSDQYPGAAVLGVDAALHTGVGMVRYLGPAKASTLVLQKAPEAVTSNGRVQAWLLGSGMDKDVRSDETAKLFAEAIGQGVPLVLDSGALDLVSAASGPVVITPHFRELARVLDEDAAAIAADPSRWARAASDRLGVTVLLKGHMTYIAGPGISLSVTGAPAWLATAGAGDALGGVLGALVATHTREIDTDHTTLARLAATASLLHGMAASRASNGGPFTITELISELPATIAAVLGK